MFKSSAKSRQQARKIVAGKTSMGLPRKVASQAYQFGSQGTSRQAVDVLALYLQWRLVNGLPKGEESNKSQIEAYLSEVAEEYEQKTLNAHRIALAKIYQIRQIANCKSLKISDEESRDYFYSEVLEIIKHQSQKNAISTLIAWTSGLRAHEFCTLKPLAEQSPSSHRSWRNDLFAGIEDCVMYTVVGKGGLSRKVAIPTGLATLLESYRLAVPNTVRDRKIDYKMHYSIGFGQALSQSFADASMRALGWSLGLHGLRHSFAKRRHAELSKLGFSFQLAMLIVSQEMGHFREEITLAYFR